MRNGGAARRAQTLVVRAGQAVLAGQPARRQRPGAAVSHLLLFRQLGNGVAALVCLRFRLPIKIRNWTINYT